jgi:hypothetical protein
LANRARRVLTQSLKRISCCALNMLNIWVGYYISVWSPGCTTFENQDASKIGSEGRMSIPNRPVVDIPEVGPAFPFVSLVLSAGCSLDGWCIGKESSVFRPSPLAGSQTGVGLGYTCYGMYESSVFRTSPLAGSQTGVGSGYTWSLSQFLG